MIDESYSKVYTVFIKYKERIRSQILGELNKITVLQKLNMKREYYDKSIVTHSVIGNEFYSYVCNLINEFLH